MLAHGFEDLTGAEWRLLEALAARADVHVSLPYEPGRAVYASLRRTADDLAKLAGDGSSSCAPRVGGVPARAAGPPGASAVHRRSGAGAARRIDPLPGRRRHPRHARARRGGGARAHPRRDAARADRRRLPLRRCGAAPSDERVRRARRSRRVRGPTSAQNDGASGTRCSRCSALPGSPATGQSSTRTFARRTRVSDGETWTGSRAGCAGAGSAAATVPLRSRSSSATAALCRRSTSSVAPPTPVEAVRALAASMLRNAHGTSAPPLGGRAQEDLEAHDSTTRALDELDALAGAGRHVSQSDVLATLERATVRGERPGAIGRVAVLDLMRARTRRFDTVFVLGLEEGSLPRRPRVEPFLDDDVRSALDERRGARLVRPDAASRDRYLFATACSRPRRRLVLVRQAVGDEGTPREASPFWEAVRAVFDPDDVRRQTTRRPLSGLTWELEDAPTDRERLRALAANRVPRAARGGGARARERLGAQAPACDARVRAADAPDTRARAAPRREPRRVLRLRPRADGVLLVGVVRRALSAPGDDRQGDRPHDARLDPPCRVAALLPAAAERDPGRRPRDGGERRGGRHADARMRVAGGRDRAPDRRRRPRPPGARAGAAARPRAARA